MWMNQLRLLLGGLRNSSLKGIRCSRNGWVGLELSSEVRSADVGGAMTVVPGHRKSSIPEIK